MHLMEMIADERRGLADLLEQLTPEQLGTPSLCTGWTVQDVAAHLVTPLETKLTTFLAAVVAGRGDLDKANVRLTARYAVRPTADLAAALRRNADKAFKPPTMPFEAPLTDLLVHGQDIRRPLGLAREFPADRLLASLRFLQTEPRGFSKKGRLAGLALEATDLDWSYGSGAAVRGSGEALLLAMSGRPAALADLDGDGVKLLADRLA